MEQSNIGILHNIIPHTSPSEIYTYIPSPNTDLNSTVDSVNMDGINGHMSDANGSSGAHKKRERVSKACTFCRKKKIKCDGKMPCVHCVNSNGSDCHYAIDVVKKRTRKTKAAMAAAAAAANAAASNELHHLRNSGHATNGRSTVSDNSNSRSLNSLYDSDYYPPSSRDRVSKTPNSKRFDDLDTRMNRLESLLLNITDKMEHSLIHHSRSFSDETRRNSTVSADLQSPPRAQLKGVPGPQIQPHSFRDAPDLFRHHGGKEKFSLNPPMSMLSVKNKRMPNDGPTDSYNGLDLFCGNQSILQIFTDSSIEWLESKVGPENVNSVFPLKNLGNNYVQTLDNFSNVFMNPLFEGNTQHDFSGLLLDREVAFYLIGKLESVFLVSFICDAKYIRNLVRYYYDNESNPNLKKRRLHFSEMMVINVALSICIMEEVDAKPVDNDAKQDSSRPAQLENMTIENMVETQTMLFRNALFYYTRVCVVSQNFLTLQGILMMILHSEMGWAPGFNYVMMAVAVRFAHEMGLHRVETLTGLPVERQNLYRRVWYLCQYLDMDICFRDAKPPLINDNDVSTLTERDNYSLLLIDHDDVEHDSLLFEATISNTPITKDVSDKLIKLKGNHAYCGHLILALTRIRHDSYVKLHSALAKYTSFDQLVESIKGLNNQMFELAESCDHRIKPRFYNEPEFMNYTPQIVFGYGYFGDSGLENMVTFQLTYFLHMMTINRLPFQSSFYDQEENADTARIRNLSVYSARSILHLVVNLKDMSVPLLFYRYIIWFPFAACLYLLTVAINRPNNSESIEDVKLVMETSFNFFGALCRRHCGFGSTHIFNQKMVMTDVIIRVVLNIVTLVADRDSEIGFLNDERLQNHIKEAQILAPQLFSPIKDKSIPRVNFKLADGHSTSSSNSPTYEQISPAARQGPAMSKLNATNGNHHRSSTNYSAQPMGHIRQGDIVGNNEIVNGSPTSSTSTHHKISSTPLMPNMVSHQNDGSINLFPVPPQEDSLDYVNDDTMYNLFNGQFYNLPNFFFDNNVGY